MRTRTARLFFFLAAALAAAVFSFAQTSVQVPYNGTVTVTLPAGCSLNGTTVACAPTGLTGTVRARLVPSGSDDQAAIYGAAAKGAVELGCQAASGCTFKLSSSTLPNGADVYCDDGVTLTDFAAYSGWSHMFAINNNANVKLAGSGSPNACLIQMPLTFANGAIRNNCVWIENSNGVTIDGLRFDRCAEDSIYVGKGASNVRVTRIVSTNPLRNGLSVTDQVANVLVDYSDFSKASNLKGGIADGVDVEPNGTGRGAPIAGEFAKQVVFDHDKFHDNAGNGICFCLYFASSQTPLDYAITNSDASNNAGPNFEKSNWPSAMTGPTQIVKGSGNTANGAAVSFP